MLLNTPKKTPSKWTISVLDAISEHLIPHNWRVPFLHTQKINVTPEMFPEKPPDRSQLYRTLHPPIEMPWNGGVPLGRIKSETESRKVRLIVKQFKHKIRTELYHPPLHLVFTWDTHGGEHGALEAAKAAQHEFTEKHKGWINQYRVAYDELRDEFFMQVKVAHFFPRAVFMCDIPDIDLIFSRPWHLSHLKYTDANKETKYRYFIVNLEKPISVLTEVLKGSGHLDNNLLNNRRSNLESRKLITCE